jgi:hypothetical protein
MIWALTSSGLSLGYGSGKPTAVMLLAAQGLPRLTHFR